MAAAGSATVKVLVGPDEPNSYMYLTLVCVDVVGCGCMLTCVAILQYKIRHLLWSDIQKIHLKC